MTAAIFNEPFPGDMVAPLAGLAIPATVIARVGNAIK
jgi:hypothetical protein